MQLEGHGGEVYALRFDPTGVAAASASFDKQIRTESSRRVVAGDRGS